LAGIARLGAITLASAVLAACSAMPGARYDRTYADGEPVPKGGGIYKIGQPYRINGRTYSPTEISSYSAEGVASWYGRDFHGKSTANGEIYDMHAISAAHPTLPIPSYVRVTNLQNGHSLVVRVNDRGPYARNRLIDLSTGAARALGFYDHGLTRVRVEYIGRAPLTGSDDEMLMATLRHGSPAPAPANVILASARPSLPGMTEGNNRPAPADHGAPIPAGRPFALGSQTPPAPSPALQASGAASKTKTSLTTTAAPPERPQPKSVVTLRVKPSSDEPPAPTAGPAVSAVAPSTSAYSPARIDGSLGLMSGRGLY
jgi:rare lipoprotein A